MTVREESERESRCELEIHKNTTYTRLVEGRKERIENKKEKRHSFYNALGGVFVLPSNLRSSFSNLSVPLPNTPFPPTAPPLAPCLSNRYVNKFFFSSGKPSRSVNKCVSSRRTTCEATIHAAADSRTTSEFGSLRAYFRLFFKYTPMETTVSHPDMNTTKRSEAY